MNLGDKYFGFLLPDRSRGQDLAGMTTLGRLGRASSLLQKTILRLLV